MRTKKIIDFIETFTEQFTTEIQYLFYCGHCYWFAYILCGRFNGEMWFNPRIIHFAAKIDDDLFDIFGKIVPGINPLNGEQDESENEWVSWSEYQLTHREYVPDIVETCIKKIR